MKKLLLAAAIAAAALPALAQQQALPTGDQYTAQEIASKTTIIKQLLDDLGKAKTELAKAQDELAKAKKPAEAEKLTETPKAVDPTVKK